MSNSASNNVLRPLPAQQANLPSASTSPEAVTIFIPSATAMLPYQSTPMFPSGTGTIPNNVVVPVFHNTNQWSNAQPDVQWGYPSFVYSQGGFATQPYPVAQAAVHRNLLVDAPWLQRHSQQQQVYRHLQNLQVSGLASHRQSHSIGTHLGASGGLCPRVPTYNHSYVSEPPANRVLLFQVFPPFFTVQFHY